MFKFTLIGTLCLVSFASSQVSDNRRFLTSTLGVPNYFEDSWITPFADTLGCGACIRGGYIFCIPGAEGSDPATWPAGIKSKCYQTATTLAAAKLASSWTCSNTYSDPALAKGFCPFQGSKCGNIQSFDFAEVGEKTKINITLAAGETCTYKVRSFKGFPTYKPFETIGFEIENVDYDDDDINNSRRMLDGAKMGSNKTQEQRKKDGFKAESEAPRPNRSVIISRNVSQTNDTKPQKGPKRGKFNSSSSDPQKFKGGNFDKSEPLEKIRYQQISVTALANLTYRSNSRILQLEPYTMTLEIGTEDFSSAYSLAFSASLLVFSLFVFF